MWHIHQKDVAFLMNYFHISHDVLLDSLTGRTLNTGPTLTFGDKGDGEVNDNYQNAPIIQIYTLLIRVFTKTRV